MSNPKVERGVTLHILYSTPLAETNYDASFDYDESLKTKGRHFSMSQNEDVSTSFAGGSVSIS